MKLEALLAHSGIGVPDGAAGRDVRAIAYDSRKVKEGSLFVAIPGFHRDGADFVPDAVRNGAVAVVAERASDASVPVAVVIRPGS